MLASLIKQICSRRPDIPKSIKCLEEYKNKGHRPDTKTLENALLASMSGFSAVHVVVDGIDECPQLDIQREKLLKSLHRILVDAPDNLHVLLTSRKEVDIDLELRDLLSPPTRMEIDLLVRQEAINRDISLYIDSTLATKSYESWPDDVKEEAREVLIEKADCMYVIGISVPNWMDDVANGVSRGSNMSGFNLRRSKIFQA